MALIFDKLPTILVLAVLVGIFVALRRHVKSARLQLWTAAWGLIFVHFFVQLFELPNGNLTPLMFIINEGCLQLAGLFFLTSLTVFFENKKLTRGMLICSGVPAIIYTVGLAYQLDWPVFYVICIATSFYGAQLIVLVRMKVTIKAMLWVPLAIVVGIMIIGTVGIVRAWGHHYAFGYLALLTLNFGLPAFLFLKRYPRRSPGVLTTAGGFLLWGLVFPAGALLDIYAPNFHINPELWNTPKFFVAFGMILTLLEDKSEFLVSANEREGKLNQQIQRFAGITSRLLKGADVNSLCHEIAQAISETSTFRRVGIILSNDGKSVYLSGHAGMDEQSLEQIKHNCAHFWRLDHIVEILSGGTKLGQSSRLLRADWLTKFKLTFSKQEYELNRYWQQGDRVFIPLQSTRGTCVGCISLYDPRDVTRVTAEEMSKIELLASDLAVTIDNAALHRQLARSEKLAAIGQLVAGVAHELNNPLASIVGYSELISDEIDEGPARQKLEKMVREAHRMKRIIENLLRFARQNNLEKKSANLPSLLQEVLALREYHIRNHDVDVQLQIEAQLPQVALDEDQFKQILLNLLNNSIDALDAVSPKLIRIEAVRREERVVLSFSDNGPGFADMNRVFDPFYTTKPVGKGTGLGLSICYGIVKEHGGEIFAMNTEPRGARIILELPVQSAVEVNESAALVR